jgi:hypothetical protein
MKKTTFVAGVTMLAFGILAVAQTAQQTAPKVKVGTQLTARAATPAPGANVPVSGQSNTRSVATAGSSSYASASPLLRMGFLQNQFVGHVIFVNIVDVLNSFSVDFFCYDQFYIPEPLIRV